MLTPDVVAAEFTGYDSYGVQAGDLSKWGVKICELSGAAVSEAMVLVATYRGSKAPSVADIFAFLLARDRGAVLLTDDRRLADVAAAYRVTTHGSLWLLDSLLRDAYIDPATALHALECMQTGGCRLPAVEVDRRKTAWGRHLGTEE